MELQAAKYHPQEVVHPSPKNLSWRNHPFRFPPIKLFYPWRHLSSTSLNVNMRNLFSIKITGIFLQTIRYYISTQTVAGKIHHLFDLDYIFECLNTFSPKYQTTYATIDHSRRHHSKKSNSNSRKGLMHSASCPFKVKQIHSDTFIYLQIPSYTFIYLFQYLQIPSNTIRYH